MTTTGTERIGAAGCIDGLVTIPSIDGPVLTACHCSDCKQELAAARAARTAQLGDRDPFARIPQTSDEEF